MSLPGDSFSVAVQEAFDRVDESIHESVDSSNIDSRVERCKNLLNGNDISSRVVVYDDADFLDERIPLKTIAVEKMEIHQFLPVQTPYMLPQQVLRMIFIEETGYWFLIQRKVNTTQVRYSTSTETVSLPSILMKDT